MVKAEASGKTLVFSALALAILYALFQDVIILFVAIITGATVLFAFLSVSLRSRWVKRSCRIKPAEESMRLVAGTTSIAKITIEAPKRMAIRVEHPLKFCTVKPQLCSTNEEITLEFMPRIAGTYSSEVLELIVASPLKAFEAVVQVPFRTNLMVVPRVVPAAIRALELAVAMGALAYEVPLQVLGRGTEYAETREYLSGDDLRRMDWKATARLQRLMVRQYHQDEGGKMNLVYDLKTSGPIIRDKIAREFLETAMVLTQENIPYNIITIGENETRMINFENHKKALMIAIRYALETIRTDYKILYELIEPQSSEEIINLLKLIEEDLKIEEIIPRAFEPTDTIAISCLLGDLTWLTSVHEKLEYYNKRLMLRIPSEIYLDSETLEQAYEDYEKQMKLIAMLKKKGIEVRITQ